MKYELDQLKTLVENGDKAALDAYLLKGMEKSDMPSVLTTNAEVKSYFDSEKDTHHTKALDTWKANNLDGLIEAEVKKRNPEETPEQKRIRELEEKIENGEKATKRAELKNKAMAYATEQKLPAQFASKYIEKFLGDDESTTTATLAELKTDLDGLILEAVNQRFKDGGRNPAGGAPGDTSIGSTFAKNANEQSKPAETTLWD